MQQYINQWIAMLCFVAAAFEFDDFYRVIFIEWLPKMLLMSRPQEMEERVRKKRERKRRKTLEKLGLGAESGADGPAAGHRASHPYRPPPTTLPHSSSSDKILPLRGLLGLMRQDGRDPMLGRRMREPILAAVDGAVYIADHLKKQTADDDIREDWRYIGQVLDRLFLWIFSLTCLGGTCGIILRAPIIYDTREPLIQ